jgi:5'-nucleotidase
MNKDKRERLIFVTNDDGFSAKGFAAAIEVACEFGRVFAVAPATTQSGRSQAITMYEPLFLESQRQEEGVEVYSFSGTPTDCVKIAFDNLLKDERVDLVLSGINHGSNSAINVLYSGTMGAAIEGSFYGCPSIGLSLTSHDADADFTAAKKYAREIVAAVLEGGDATGRPL